jgi:hypothetical protein
MAPTAITDRMHGLLVFQADALEGCAETASEEVELAAWPLRPTCVVGADATRATDTTSAKRDAEQELMAREKSNR